MSFNIDILISSVKSANLEILDYLQNSLKDDDFLYNKTIGFGGDNSLKIDLIFENIFVKHLKSLGNILSEECGLIDNKSDITFIIDPLDGSNNFYSNLPYYGTSVAIKYKNEIVAGFVTNLATKLMTYRVLDEKVKYFSFEKKQDIKLVKNIKSKVAVFERGYNYPKICKILDKNSIKFRVLGATALSLANARDYDFVLFKGELREFDISAGLFINKELFCYQKKRVLFVSKYKENLKFFKEFIK